MQIQNVMVKKSKPIKWTLKYGLRHSHLTSSQPLLSLKQTFLALQFPFFLSCFEIF